MASNTKPQKTLSEGTGARAKDAALTQQFRKAVIQKLDTWVETVPTPDEPLIGAASGKITPLSPRDIVKHVKKRTPTGEKLVANWAELVLRNIKNTPLI